MQNNSWRLFLARSQFLNFIFYKNVINNSNFIRWVILFLLLGDDLGATYSASTTSSNETDLSTRRLEARHCRRFANVLMVTTTEWMVYGVHAHTSDLWPAVTLGLVFEVGTAGLQDRLVNTTTASNDTNHGSVQSGNGLLLARRKLDFGLLGVGVL